MFSQFGINVGSLRLLTFGKQFVSPLNHFENLLVKETCFMSLIQFIYFFGLTDTQMNTISQLLTVIMMDGLFK